jgi:hypothetical protein
MNQQQNTQPEKVASPTGSSGMTVGTILYLVFSILIGILYCYGAARLSYNKYGSIGWAIIAFIFAPFYYPIYGIFLSTPVSTGILGAARRLKR